MCIFFFNEAKKKKKQGRLDEAPVATADTYREISSKWAQQRLEGGGEAQTAC